MKTSLRRTDHGNIDGRLAAVDAQVECAERHHGVIALFFGALEAFDESRRDELYLGGRHPIKVGGGRHVNDAHLNFGR